MSGHMDSPQREQMSITLADATHAMPDQVLLPGISASCASRPFTGVMFWDPAFFGTELSDQILLGPGLDPRRADFAVVLDAAGSAGAAALMVKAAETDLSAETMPSAAGVAVLLLHRSADWAHVANTLRSLCAPQLRELATTVAIGDLFTLANTLATLVGAAVSIVDAAGQVVGYSTHADQPIDDVRRQTTLALRETVPLSQDADYRAVLTATGAIYVPAESDGQFGRAARAVRSAGELLGTVWVVQPDDSTAAATGQLLDSTEPLVAQHLLQARIDTAERDRRTGDLLHALFDDAGAARRAAAELLLPPDGTHTVLCTANPVATPDQPALHLHRLAQVVKTVAPAYFSHSHSAIVGHHVATLVTESDPARVRRFAEHLAGRHPALMVGIGRPTPTTAHIAQSHREAAGALGALLAPLSNLRSANINRRVAVFDEVREQLGLMRVAAVLDDLEITDSDDAARLLALDAETGSDLSATLLTYLDTQQSVRTTAELLHVHQNTIRYRLAALRDDLGVDIDDPTKRLWLWLRLSTAPGSASVHSR